MSTTIKLKKSGASGNVPLSATLEHGELALNYADGILYFKNAANQIQQISGTTANTFETINANGSLLIADSNVDILSIAAGSGINITANPTTDTLTIAARLNDTVTSTDTTQIATANSVKTAYDQASNAYNAANNAAVRVTANAGPTITANTINFNNSATVNVTVTQNGTTANISFSANGVGGVANVSTINSNRFTGNASCTQFILASSNFSTNGIFVFIDGVTQVPTVDYNLAGSTLTFVDPPANNSVIEVRSFQNISVGATSNLITQGSTTLSVVILRIVLMRMDSLFLLMRLIDNICYAERLLIIQKQNYFYLLVLAFQFLQTLPYFILLILLRVEPMQLTNQQDFTLRV